MRNGTTSISGPLGPCEVTLGVRLAHVERNDTAGLDWRSPFLQQFLGQGEQGGRWWKGQCRREGVDAVDGPEHVGVAQRTVPDRLHGGAATECAERLGQI